MVFITETRIERPITYKKKIISNNCAFFRRRKHQHTSSFIYVINTNKRTNTRAPTACKFNIYWHITLHSCGLNDLSNFSKQNKNGDGTVSWFQKFTLSHHNWMDHAQNCMLRQMKEDVSSEQKKNEMKLKLIIYNITERKAHIITLHFFHVLFCDLTLKLSFTKNSPLLIHP